MSTARPTPTPNGWELSEVYQTLALSIRRSDVANALLAAAEIDLAGHGRHAFRLVCDAVCADVGIARFTATAECLYYYHRWVSAVQLQRQQQQQVSLGLETAAPVVGPAASLSAAVESARQSLAYAVYLAAVAEKSRLSFNAAAATLGGDAHTLIDFESAHLNDALAVVAECMPRVLDSITWTAHLEPSDGDTRTHDDDDDKNRGNRDAPSLDATRLARLFVALLQMAGDAWDMVSAHMDEHPHGGLSDANTQPGRPSLAGDADGTAGPVQSEVPTTLDDYVAVAHVHEASVLLVGHMLYALDVVERRRVVHSAADCPAGALSQTPTTPCLPSDSTQPSCVAVPIAFQRAFAHLGEKRSTVFALLQRARSESVFARPLIWTYATLVEVTLARVTDTEEECAGDGKDATEESRVQIGERRKTANHLLGALLSLANLTGELLVDDHVAFVLATLLTVRAGVLGRVGLGGVCRMPACMADARTTSAMNHYAATIAAVTSRADSKRVASTLTVAGVAPTDTSSLERRRLVIPTDAINVFTFRGRGIDTSNLLDGVLGPLRAEVATADRVAGSRAMAIDGHAVATWSQAERARSYGHGVDRPASRADPGETRLSHWWDRSARVCQPSQARPLNPSRAVGLSDPYANEARSVVLAWEAERNLALPSSGIVNTHFPQTRLIVEDRYAGWAALFATTPSGLHTGAPVRIPTLAPQALSTPAPTEAGPTLRATLSEPVSAAGDVTHRPEHDSVVVVVEPRTGARPCAIGAPITLLPGQAMLTVGYAQIVVPVEDTRLCTPPGSLPWRVERHGDLWMHVLAQPALGSSASRIVHDGLLALEPPGAPSLDGSRPASDRLEPGTSDVTMAQCPERVLPCHAGGTPAALSMALPPLPPPLPQHSPMQHHVPAPVTLSATHEGSTRSDSRVRSRRASNSKRTKTKNDAVFDILTSTRARDIADAERAALECGWLARIPPNANKKARILTKEGVYIGPWWAHRVTDQQGVQKMLLRTFRARHCWGASIVIDQVPVIDPTPGGVGDCDRMGDRDDACALFYFRSDFLGDARADPTQWRHAVPDAKRGKKVPANPDSIVWTLPPQLRRRTDRHPALAESEGARLMGDYVLPPVADRASTGVLPFNMSLPEPVLRRHMPAVVRDLAMRYLLGTGNAQLGNVIVTVEYDPADAAVDPEIVFPVEGAAAAPSGPQYARIGRFIGSLHLDETRDCTPLLPRDVLDTMSTSNGIPSPPPTSAVTNVAANVTLMGCLFASSKAPTAGHDIGRFYDLLPQCIDNLRELIHRVENEDRSRIADYAASIGMPGLLPVDRPLKARLDTLSWCIERFAAQHEAQRDETTDTPRRASSSRSRRHSDEHKSEATPSRKRRSSRSASATDELSSTPASPRPRSRRSSVITTEVVPDVGLSVEPSSKRTQRSSSSKKRTSDGNIADASVMGAASSGDAHAGTNMASRKRSRVSGGGKNRRSSVNRGGASDEQTAIGTAAGTHVPSLGALGTEDATHNPGSRASSTRKRRPKDAQGHKSRSRRRAADESTQHEDDTSLAAIVVTPRATTQVDDDMVAAAIAGKSPAAASAPALPPTTGQTALLASGRRVSFNLASPATGANENGLEEEPRDRHAHGQRKRGHNANGDDNDSDDDGNDDDDDNNIYCDADDMSHKARAAKAAHHDALASEGWSRDQRAQYWLDAQSHRGRLDRLPNDDSECNDTDSQDDSDYYADREPTALSPRTRTHDRRAQRSDEDSDIESSRLRKKARLVPAIDASHDVNSATEMSLAATKAPGKRRRGSKPAADNVHAQTLSMSTVGSVLMARRESDRTRSSNSTSSTPARRQSREAHPHMPTSSDPRYNDDGESQSNDEEDSGSSEYDEQENDAYAAKCPRHESPRRSRGDSLARNGAK